MKKIDYREIGKKPGRNRRIKYNIKPKIIPKQNRTLQIFLPTSTLNRFLFQIYTLKTGSIDNLV